MKTDDKILEESVEIAKIEFEKEPMDAYYKSKIAGFFSRLRVRKIIQEFLSLSSNGKRCLDIGCEAGYVSIEMAKVGAEVFSFDILHEALKDFQRKLKTFSDINKPHILLAAAQKIPFENDTFDFVICTEVIEHTPRPELVIKEIARVMKKGGKTVITFPNEKLRKRTYPIIKKLFGIDTTVESRVTLFSYELDNIVEICRNELDVVRIFSIPLLFPLTHFIICEKGDDER